MLTRLTRGQVFAFVFLGLVALAYASIVYVKLPQKLGVGRYYVSVELPNTSDLYESSAVTLRGHQIGEVKKLELTDTAVRATLDIDDAAKIPVDSVAQIRSVSAIGEQYLNFVPTREDGPALQPNDVVPVSKVKLPVPEVDVLKNVDTLVTSIPAADLNTTVDEFATGFANTGDSLGRLLDATADLTKTAQDNLPALRGLIDNLQPFLATQQRLSPQLHSEFANLNKFTGVVRDSDPELRGTIDKIPPVNHEVRALVGDLKDPLPRLLNDLTNVGEVVKVYLPAVQQTLVVLPTGLNALQNTVYASQIFGAAKLDFKAVLQDPPACNTGFLPDSANRSPFDQSYRPPAYNANCKTPKDAFTGVRDGKNYPCPNNDRRAISAADCGLKFQSKDDAQRAEDEATETMKKSFFDRPDSRKVPAYSIFPAAGDAGYEDGALHDDPYNPLNYGVPGTPLFNAQTGFGPRIPLSNSSNLSLKTSSPGSVTTYDQATGAFLAPDGAPFLLGGARTAAPGSDWRSLLNGPLGVGGK